jgi:lipoprotein-anchoring transpeptidase ErfK/SrfK
MLALLTGLVLAQAPDDFLSRCPSPVVAPVRPTRGRVELPGGGTVTSVDDGRVRATLCAYENHELREVRFEAQVAAVGLAVGARLERGTSLGRGTFTLDGLAPERFFRQHRFLVDLHAEPVLLVVDVEAHEARRYERGVRTHTWEVGRGQAEGVKVQRGDLKTPRGLYFVTDKSTGPFAGPFAGYYGGHWVKVNYPNAFDAERGVAAGWLSPAQGAEVARTWWRRALPAQQTKLGGGIGFHGWIAPWRGDVEGFGLSWGCVVLHPEDIADFYASVPVGAAVLLR